ncbi:MAG: endonuclease/exonuclease/phosphatase family protein [Planctomycetes bacterium]|nr:endonuclease/exonuclease/phosphatase family protein [Planctomycetota bacterium]
MSTQPRHTGRCLRQLLGLLLILSALSTLNAFYPFSYLGWTGHFQFHLLIASILSLLLFRIPRVRAAFWRPIRVQLLFCVTGFTHFLIVAAALAPLTQPDLVEPIPIRLGWFNAQWNPDALDLVLGLFTDEDVDFFGIAEVPFDFHNGNPRLANWPHLAYSPSHQLLLASRTPLESTRLPRAGWPTMIKTATTIQGRSIHLHGAHLSIPFSSNHKRQFERLPQMLAKEHKSTQAKSASLAMGDFNSTPWVQEFADLQQSGWRDTRRGHWPTPTWGPFGHFWVGLPIDQMLISGPLRCLNFRVGPDCLSDHKPLLVDLELGRPRREYTIGQN